MAEYKKNLERFDSFFRGYQHNVPVIYSTITGQYDGTVYFYEEEGIAILVTAFDFIFVAGNSSHPKAEELVHDLIFNHLVKKEQRKEIIMFGPDERWNMILERVFQLHHGVKDDRKCYQLNRDKFKKVVNEFEGKLSNIMLEQEHENNSKFDYPVANYYVEHEKASFCAAFMMTDQHAEIDVGTQETYRNHGYAKKAALVLIQHLIERGIEPNWCTWPYRKESQNLALSIGFELETDVPAHIWVEDFGL